MIGDLRDTIERSDEFLGRVRLEDLDDAAAALDRAGFSGLAHSVLDASSLVAAARRALSRARPLVEVDRGITRKGKGGRDASV